MIGLVLGLVGTPVGRPTRVSIRLRGRAQALLVALAQGLALGLGGGLGFALTFGTDRKAAAALGLVGGVAIAFGTWLRVPLPDAPAANLASVLRADRTATLVGALIAGVGVGTVTWLAAGPIWALMATPIGAISVAGSASWTHFAVGRAWYGLTGRLPWRLMTYLEDAHKLGVLRQAGPVYQFRHARLRERLSSNSAGRQLSNVPAPTSPVRGARRTAIGAAVSGLVLCVLAASALACLPLSNTIHDPALRLATSAAPRYDSPSLVSEGPSVGCNATPTGTRVGTSAHHYSLCGFSYRNTGDFAVEAQIEIGEDAEGGIYVGSDGVVTTFYLTPEGIYRLFIRGDDRIRFPRFGFTPAARTGHGQPNTLGCGSLAGRSTVGFVPVW